MAERAASKETATDNVMRILRETGNGPLLTTPDALDVSRQLRQELSAKGLKGFKRGGKVKKTGVYKLHKGEKVLTRRQALYGKGD